MSPAAGIIRGPARALTAVVAATGVLVGCREVGRSRGPLVPDGAEASHEALISRYIDAWTGFYPDRAAELGLAGHAGRSEDRSPEAVQRWVALNDSLLARITAAPPGLSLDVRIDLRLLRSQARTELERWRERGAAAADAAGGVEAERLGRAAYAEALLRYYDLEITPEEVAQRALAEIREVRGLMARTAVSLWRDTRGDEPVPDERAVVAWALSRMEENRATSQQESLELFTRFADEAEAFVRDRGLATLPEERTLDIVLTPSSAGPAQRIGFVRAAPPFDPDGRTVLSLPTIEDTFPEREKEAFYRSFNNHFNKAIIIHELFPGHYLQTKLAAGNPRRARVLFPYEPFSEGWATLMEKIALDAGWDDFDRLTYLAHLRKRLENANRAYTSVQVHCFGWTEEQVLRFSQEESLVAPQFAASLFGRLQRSPMQMTSYFMGSDALTRILEAEKARLGEGFEVRAFNDALLRAGAVPFDMIPEVLAAG